MANELVIPPDIRPESGETVELVDDQTFAFRPQFGRSWSQRNSYGDPRWRLSRAYRGLRMSDRARLHAIVSEAQGGFRTIMVSPNQDPRGTWASVVGGELFTNADFSSGTTGWTASSGGALTVSDAIAKLSISAVGAAASFSRTVTFPTQYVPYVLRSIILDGAQSAGISIGPFIADATASANAYSTSRGYRVASIVSEISSSTSNFPAVFITTSGYTAGAYALVPFTSLSQCFYVDGGGNRILQSDTLDNASWSKSASSVTADATTSPDGTSTADAIVENSATSGHYILQNGARTFAVTDLCTYGFFKRGSGTRDIRLVAGNDGLNYSVCIFNLGAGTAGSVTNVGTATNGRAYIASAGNGWYFCCVVSRATVATTTIIAEFDLVSGGNTSYTGDGTSSVYAWRCGATISGVPTRGSQTTSAAVAAASQSGAGVYVKGLPVSQSGLLAAGDWVEIDGQLKQLTAALNSDAAGMGYLQVRPQVARAVADNTPVIVTKPLGRFLLSDRIAYQAQFGLYSDFELTLDEVYE